MQKSEVMPGSRAAIALSYMDFVKGDAPRTSTPNFSFECWEELARIVDTENFVRAGRDGERMTWPQAVQLMHRSVGTPKQYSLRRAMEVEDRVYLEMAETIGSGEKKYQFNSIYIFRFNSVDKIVSLEFYQQ